MPKRDKKFRTPFNLNDWGRQKLRERNAAAEERARYEIAAWNAAQMEESRLATDWEAEHLKVEENLRKLKKMKGCKKKLVFVTLNYDEKLVTPTGTVPYVKRILDHAKVTQAFAYWEWRDTEAETGLHTHIVLQGETRRIVEMLKRTKGPFTRLCSEYNTVKKYPLKYWKDKCEYNETTFDETKNNLKSQYERLRIKYELPNLSK